MVDLKYFKVPGLLIDEVALEWGKSIAHPCFHTQGSAGVDGWIRAVGTQTQRTRNKIKYTRTKNEYL